MICAVCGAEFQAKAEHSKYCCKTCANASRFTRRKTDWYSEVAERSKAITADYYTDKSTKEIAIEHGVTVSAVYKAWHDAGLPKRLTKNQKAVKELREKKMCSVEIADATGLSLKSVKAIAKAIEMPFTKEEVERSAELGRQRQTNQYTNGWFDRIANAKRYIEQYGEFEYVGGFTSVDGFVDIQCKKCGTVTRKSMVTIRKHKNVQCAECARRERERRKAEEDARKQTAKQERKPVINGKQMTFKVCVCCGGLFVAGKKKIYCSDTCRNKSQNALAKDKRVRKIKKALVDKGITLEALYERDGGVCYLCGEPCDWNDYEVRSNGAFIAFDNYPSIDHVVPLSKGGKHAWINIRLAHRRCNTKKGDNVQPSHGAV